MIVFFETAGAFWINLRFLLHLRPPISFCYCRQSQISWVATSKLNDTRQPNYVLLIFRSLKNPTEIQPHICVPLTLICYIRLQWQHATVTPHSVILNWTLFTSSRVQVMLHVLIPHPTNNGVWNNPQLCFNYYANLIRKCWKYTVPGHFIKNGLLEGTRMMMQPSSQHCCGQKQKQNKDYKHCKHVT